MEDILKVAVSAAKQAGDFLLYNFGKVSAIQKKGDRNFATNLDQEAERIALAAIGARFPGHGIIAEESGKRDTGSDYLWIIDPLDGTHNFMRNIAIFGVSIGILYKKDFVAGVIYMPKDKEVYLAEKGSGAYKNGKKIAVSTTDTLNNCSISFDSSIRYSPQVMLEVLGDLAEKVFNIRMFGSSARVLSYIAEGRLDFAVEFHDRPWDFAGGVCIVEEAGGRIAELRTGCRVSHETIGYIASNARVYDMVNAVVRARLP